MKLKDLLGAAEKLDWGGYAKAEDEAAQAAGGPVTKVNGERQPGRFTPQGQTGAGPGRQPVTGRSNARHDDERPVSPLASVQELLGT